MLNNVDASGFTSVFRSHSQFEFRGPEFLSKSLPANRFPAFTQADGPLSSQNEPTFDPRPRRQHYTPRHPTLILYFRMATYDPNSCPISFLRTNKILTILNTIAYITLKDPGPTSQRTQFPSIIKTSRRVLYKKINTVYIKNEVGSVSTHNIRKM